MRKNKRWLAVLLAGSVLFSANTGLVYASELPGMAAEDPAAMSEQVSVGQSEEGQKDQPEVTENSGETPKASEEAADTIEEGTEDERNASADQDTATGEEQQEIPDEISKEQGASTAAEEDLQNPASEDAETTDGYGQTPLTARGMERPRGRARFQRSRRSWCHRVSRRSEITLSQAVPM